MWEPSIDPAREYDIYCARQEKAYRELIANAICANCYNCEQPGDEWENPERMGYCTLSGEFVSLDESVEDIGCEDFE